MFSVGRLRVHGYLCRSERSHLVFSSGFDSPFGPFPPSYTEHNEAS